MMMGTIFWFLLLGLGCCLMKLFLFGQMSQIYGNDQMQEKRKRVKKSAFEIVDERYAAGEISYQEYNEIIDDLEGHSPAHHLQDH